MRLVGFIGCRVGPHNDSECGVRALCVSAAGAGNVLTCSLCAVSECAVCCVCVCVCVGGCHGNGWAMVGRTYELLYTSRFFLLRSFTSFLVYFVSLCRLCVVGTCRSGRPAHCVC